MTAFDMLLLLAKGGRVAYFGPAQTAVDYLSRAMAGSERALNPADYANPGDYIIDVIGLDPSRTDNGDGDGDGDGNGGDGHGGVAIDPADVWPTSAEAAAVVRGLAERRNAAAQRQRPLARRKMVPVASQAWVLYARHVVRYDTLSTATNLDSAQALLVTIIIAYTFSYTAGGAFNDAYRQLTASYLIITYAMIVQYLTGTPVYYEDRPTINKEYRSGAVSIRSYLLSSFIVDTSRCLRQCCIIVLVSYWWLRLAPEPPRVFFFFCCTVIGCMALQGIICVITFTTDKLAVAYNGLQR